MGLHHGTFHDLIMQTLRNISIWLYEKSTGWIALISLIIFILFMVIILPAQAREANSLSQDAGSPDMSFFYTPEELYNMAEVYGEQGTGQLTFTHDLHLI